MRQAVPLQPIEVHGGADIHLQPMADPTLEQVDVPEGSCDPMESPCWSRLLSAAVAPWEGPHTGAEEEHEEEGVAETTCDELTATPAPCPPALRGGRRWRSQE